MTLTFVDAGVLIAAARGTGSAASKAAEILDDPDRSFASSVFVRLEVLPKAVFHRKAQEAEFYEAFFESVEIWVSPDHLLAEQAMTLAARFGLSALDALHVAAAMAAGADEVVTSEKPSRPIHRVTGLAVKSIHP